MTVVAIPNARAERLLVLVGRALAVAGVALGLVPYFVFVRISGPIWNTIAACLWTIAPLPIAWWIGRSVARAKAALAVLVAGMALALAFEALIHWRIYWNAFLDQSFRVASDLAIIGMPLFQLPFLVVIVLLAWLIQRRKNWT